MSLCSTPTLDDHCELVCICLVLFTLVSKEYETKLWKYDVKYHGTAPRIRGQPEPAPGPLVRRLRSFPMIKLIAGPWASTNFLGVFAKASAEAEARSKGKAGGQVQGFLGKLWVR